MCASIVVFEEFICARSTARQLAALQPRGRRARARAPRSFPALRVREICGGANIE